MGARTRRIRFRTSVVLAPLYDPIKLAEDAAVTQLATNGRLILGIGGGYRPSEFETFGRKLEDRWRVVGETIELLRRAWTGEPFEWQGRRCWVTPRPIPRRRSCSAAARRGRRAAPRGSPTAGSRRSSRSSGRPTATSVLKLGKPDPGEYPKQGPIFLWISHEPDKDWEPPHAARAAPAALVQRVDDRGLRPAVGPYAKQMTPETIRQSPAYRVLTPEQTLALAPSSATTACST
jgi:hypothetical protein